MENGDLQTVGIEDYGRKLKHPFTAHPKIDPKTGEYWPVHTALHIHSLPSVSATCRFNLAKWIFRCYYKMHLNVDYHWVLDLKFIIWKCMSGEMFIFRFQPFFIPALSYTRLIYRVISKDGVLGDLVKITTPRPIMMHDFAISENYASFMDLTLCANPKVCKQTRHHTILKCPR